MGKLYRTHGDCVTPVHHSPNTEVSIKQPDLSWGFDVKDVVQVTLKQSKVVGSLGIVAGLAYRVNLSDGDIPLVLVRFPTFDKLVAYSTGSLTKL